MITNQIALSGIVRRNPPVSLKAACLAALAFASLATTGVFAASRPPPSKPAAKSAPISHVISRVDVNAKTLRDQPNITGIGMMIGPDGHAHVFCVDPSDPAPALRLHRKMQSGTDTLRYK